MSEAKPTHTTPKSRRRWLRFSMRTLLLVMFVASVLFAWLGKHVVRSQIQRPIVARIQAAGGSVYYDYQMEPRPKNSIPGSSIVRWILGDDIYATVNVVSLDDKKTTDDDVVRLNKLTELVSVSLNGTDVTDDCVDNLLRIRCLRDLDLANTSITPDGLNRLSNSNTSTLR